MEAALGTAVGTLQPEWCWTRELDARVVGAAALLVADSVCSGSGNGGPGAAAAQGTGDGAGLVWLRAVETGVAVAKGLGAAEKQEAGRENNLISKRLPLLLLL